MPEERTREELMRKALELFLRMAVTAQDGKEVPWPLWAIMTAAYNAAEEGMPRAEEFLLLAKQVFDHDLPSSVRDGILKTPLPLDLGWPQVPDSLPEDVAESDDLDRLAGWFSGIYSQVLSLMERGRSHGFPSERTEALFLLLLALQNAVHRGLSISVPVLRGLEEGWNALQVDERADLLQEPVPGRIRPGAAGRRQPRM